MARRKKQKDRYESRIACWLNDDGSISGTLSIDPEFLESVLDEFYDNNPDVVDDYDEESVMVQLGITLRESEYDGTDYYGGVYIKKPKDKKGGGGRSRRRSRR